MPGYIKGTAVVTGASSGIGALYADRLAHRGYDLILVARRRERLDGLAQRLIAETGRMVDCIAADLNDKAELSRIEALLRSDDRITMLINNAGVGATAPLLDSDVYKMSQMIGLNADVLTRLSYALAPAFVKRNAGTIINIASVVAIRPEVLNGVYAGTKAFVLAFSRSLRQELADKGVRIQVVLPGATATDFWADAGLPVEHLPSEIVMPASEMVDAALAGLDQGEFVTIPSLPNVGDWHAFEAARQSLIPNLSHKAAAARYRTSSTS